MLCKNISFEDQNIILQPTHTKSTSAKDLSEGNKKECTILINHLCNHLCLKIKSYFKHLIDNYLGRAGVEND